MNEIIPRKKICKSEVSNRPKLSSDTYKLNKWLMRIVKAAKKNRLYEIKDENREFFIEKLKNTVEKYNIKKVDVDLIKNSLDNNDKDIILKELKDLCNIVIVKLKVENKLFVLDQIEKSVEKRIEYMDENKKKMLNSCLEKENRTININRLLIKKENNIELILDKDEILKETNKHFKGISDVTLKRDNSLEQFWKNEYLPRGDIEIDIYKELLIDIEEDEMNEALKSLSKGKAGGPSKITYEILQECSSKMKLILRKFYNEVLSTTLMPIKWFIYPIPKPGDWNLDLNKTRPIT